MAMVLVELPDETLTAIRVMVACGSGNGADELVANGTVLLDNATNGDVLKALFPNVITQEAAVTIHATTKVVSNGVKGGISFDFWKDWWNAPYKEQENGTNEKISD